MPTRLFTAEQIAALLGAAVGDVTRWMRKGWLPFQKLPDGPVRISERGLLAFLKDRGIDISEIAARIGEQESSEPPGPHGGVRQPAMAPSVASSAHQDNPHLPASESGSVAQRFPLTASAETRPPWRGLARASALADRFPLAAAPAIAAVEPLPAEAPALTAEAPAPTAEAPAPTAEAPAPTTEAPAPTAEAPAPTAKAPVPTTEAPAPLREDDPPTAPTEPPPTPEPIEDTPPVEDKPPVETDAPDDADATIETDRADEPVEDSPRATAEAILAAAAGDGASEIYLQPGRSGLRLRVRIDGRVRDEPAFAQRLAEPCGQGVIEYFRSLLRGGEPREIAGHQMRLDLSTWPTVHGPAVAISLSTDDEQAGGLAQLGLGAADERILRDLLADGSGLVVMAARPHSGQMAALREMLAELNTPDRLVLAVGRFQDIRLDGVAAVRLARGGGGTYAETIHLATAGNADVILVEDLRDPSTGLAAVDAAEEGRLVLAGMSAASPAAAAQLLLEMGCEPWPLASTLRACLSYRSVRALCGKCKQVARPGEDVLRRLGMKRDAVDFWTYEAHGCEACSSTGYIGKVGLLSAMLVRGEVARQLRSGGNAAALGDAAAGEGMLTAVQAGLQKARDGVTSLAEVVRLQGDMPPANTS